MSKKLHKAIYQYVSGLRHRYADSIITVVLFGSTARGESGKESDVGILIVTSEKNPRTKDAISMAAYDIMLKNNVVLSPLVMDAATFSWYKKFKVFVEICGLLNTDEALKSCHTGGNRCPVRYADLIFPDTGLRRYDDFAGFSTGMKHH